MQALSARRGETLVAEKQTLRGADNECSGKIFRSSRSSRRNHSCVTGVLTHTPFFQSHLMSVIDSGLISLIGAWSRLGSVEGFRVFQRGVSPCSTAHVQIREQGWKWAISGLERKSIFVTHNVVFLRYSYASLLFLRWFSTLSLVGWIGTMLGLWV